MNNPLLTNIPTLYPLKTKIFGCFQGVLDRSIDKSWVKTNINIFKTFSAMSLHGITIVECFVWYKLNLMIKIEKNNFLTCS